MVTVNINELWRRFRQGSKKARATLAAERFLKLFEEHGVAATQIQHFLPQVTLDKIQKPEALLPILTPDLLEQASRLFKVKRTWLEGVDNEIYDCAFCYQTPDEFFEEFAAIRHERGYASIRGLRCTKTLDYRDPNPQPITLVFIERIRELGDVEVFRYRVFGDGWDWS
jgi:hypothetical protein